MEIINLNIAEIKEIITMNLDSLEIKRSSFDLFNENTPTEISMVLKGFYEPIRKPVIVCIGSDLVLGDCLGPLVGTLLK